MVKNSTPKNEIQEEELKMHSQELVDTNFDDEKEECLVQQNTTLGGSRITARNTNSVSMGSVTRTSPATTAL